VVDQEEVHHAFCKVTPGAGSALLLTVGEGRD
jgi:hypothetical protein